MRLPCVALQYVTDAPTGQETWSRDFSAGGSGRDLSPGPTFGLSCWSSQCCGAGSSRVEPAPAVWSRHFSAGDPAGTEVPAYMRIAEVRALDLPGGGQLQDPDRSKQPGREQRRVRLVHDWPCKRELL